MSDRGKKDHFQFYRIETFGPEPRLVRDQATIDAETVRKLIAAHGRYERQLATPGKRREGPVKMSGPLKKALDKGGGFVGHDAPVEKRIRAAVYGVSKDGLIREQKKGRSRPSQEMYERWTIRDVIAEAERSDPANHPHVPQPRTPIRLAGISGAALLKELEDAHAKAVDSRGHALRKDAQILVSVVVSWPIPIEDMTTKAGRTIEDFERFMDPARPDPANPPETWIACRRWSEMALAYEVRRGRVRNAVGHIDEDYWHLHIQHAPALANNGTLSIDALHPGVRARSQVRATMGTKTGRTDAETAFKEAINTLRRDFHAKVSKPFGHLLEGDQPRRRESYREYQRRKQRERIARARAEEQEINRRIAEVAARRAWDEIEKRKVAEAKLAEAECDRYERRRRDEAFKAWAAAKIGKQFRGEEGRDDPDAEVWTMITELVDYHERTVTRERGRSDRLERETKTLHEELAAARAEASTWQSRFEQLGREIVVFRRRTAMIIRALLEPGRYLEAAKAVLGMSHRKADLITAEEFREVQRKVAPEAKIEEMMIHQAARAMLHEPPQEQRQRERTLG